MAAPISDVWFVIDNIETFEDSKLVEIVRSLRCNLGIIQSGFMSSMLNPEEFKLASLNLVKLLNCFNQEDNKVLEQLTILLPEYATLTLRVRFIVQEVEKYLVEVGITRDSIIPPQLNEDEIIKSLDFQDSRQLGSEMRSFFNTISDLSEILRQAHWGDGLTPQEFNFIISSFKTSLGCRLFPQF